MPWSGRFGRMRGWRCFRSSGGFWRAGLGRGRGGGVRAGGPTKCVCPNCGYEIPHVRGRPCSAETCPKCGTPMVGKWE